MQLTLQRLVSLTLLLAASVYAGGSDYHVGIGEVSCIQQLGTFAVAGGLIADGCCAGKADITGPAADVNMMVSRERFVGDCHLLFQLALLACCLLPLRGMLCWSRLFLAYIHAFMQEHI